MIRALALAALLSAAPASAGLFASRLSDPLEGPKKLFDAGKYAEVIAKLSPEAMQRLRGGDLKNAYLYLAESHEKTGRLEKAIGVYQLAATLYPRDAEVLTRLASLLHQAGLEEQAEPLYQKILKLKPDSAAAHLGLAEIDHSLGFLDRSAQHYEKTLEAMETAAAVWRDYAQVLLERRDLKTAELAIQRSLSLGPDDDSAVLLAFIQRAQSRLDEALQTLEAVLAQAPKRTELTLTRALWLIEAGRHAPALAAVESVLKETPDDPLARWIRARLHLKADRANLALRDLEAAAAASRRAPFVAEAASALLAQLKAGR